MTTSKFALPDISDTVIDRSGYMNPAWYRAFELLEKQLSVFVDNIDDIQAVATALQDAKDHQQSLLQNIQASIEDFTNVSISAGDGLTGGGTLVDGLTGGSVSFALAGAVVGAASEALAANDLVNIFDAGGGVFEVRKADADAGKPCHAYVKEAFALAATVTVYTSGIAAGQTGLTPGYVYLSATPGLATSVVPTAGGAQRVGVAVSATSFAFLWQDPFDI